MSAEPARSMPSIGATPAYPDVKLYANMLGGLRIWEGDGWKPETMSWKTGCYIHSGLSGLPEMIFRGPDAGRFLASISINGTDWPIGKSRHLVMLDDNGLITNHSLAMRDDEETYRHFASVPWSAYKLYSAGMNVDLQMRDIFVLQVAGPTSLTVLERATGESLRDVGFLVTRPTQVPGADADIEVSRIGMSGNLAYELRGPIEAGPTVYEIVYRAGQDLGIKRLGWRDYVVNHVEGGFPQLGCTFTTSGATDPGFLGIVPPPMVAEWMAGSGSVDPADLRARFRSPVEVDWEWMARFDHDFIGREALEKEIADPKRTIVTLRWNPEDMIDIYSSLFQPGEDYRTFDLPSCPTPPGGTHADHVTKGDKPVGVSSGATYSYYFREVISHCTIDRDQAKIGNEVTVHWGDYGKRIKEVRATVSRYPYLDLPRNQVYDLSTVPSGVPGS